MFAKAVRFVVPMLILGALVAPTASAETKTQTVKGEVVFANGQRPGDPGDCSAVVFVKWADVRGTTSATAVYTWKGEEYRETAAPPFHDTTTLVATYVVPAGYHWISVGRSWRNGPTPSTCQDFTDRQRVDFGHEATVELTVEIDPKVCNAAKAKLTARRKSVNSLKSQLRKATTQKAKSKLRSRLATATTKRDKAAGRVREVC